MSLRHDGASPSGPDGIRDESLVRWALAWTVSSVLASVLMMALTSRTTPLNACWDKRGAAEDSSPLGSRTSRLGETPLFVLRMASSSRCAHHLYTTRNEHRLAMGQTSSWRRPRSRLSE